MTYNDIISEISQDLIVELQTDSTLNEDILLIKVKNALAEVIDRRSYPEDYSEDKICADLQKLKYKIAMIARYDYNQLGAEGESQHTESSVQRSWQKRESMFYGIFPFVRVLQ